jgi:hypothetical protein
MHSRPPAHHPIFVRDQGIEARCNSAVEPRSIRDHCGDATAWAEPEGAGAVGATGTCWATVCI